MLKIVPMQMVDLEAVYVLEKASFPVPKDISIFLADQNKYFVVKEKEKVVGYIGFEEIAGEGHIINLAVVPELRRKGIGKSLVQSVLDKTQIKVFYLEVRESNVAAHKLYQGLNFKIVGKRKAYYQDNHEDALIMKLNKIATFF